MTDPQDSDQELRIDESPENDSDVLCLGEYNASENRKNSIKNCNKSDNCEKYDKNCKTLDNIKADNNVDGTTKINSDKIIKDEEVLKNNYESMDIDMKDDGEFKISSEKKAASHSPKTNEDVNCIGKRDIKKKDGIKDIKDIHKEIILKPSTEGLLKIPQNRTSNDDTLKNNDNQYMNRNSRASSVCSSSSLQRNKRKSNTPKHVNFISERLNNAFEENELKKQKILDILQGASTDTDYKSKGEKRRSDDSDDSIVDEKRIREDKNVPNNNVFKNEKLPAPKATINSETTLGKLLGEKDKIDEKPKEATTKNSVNVASPKDANFAPIKPKPSPAMIFKPMKYQTSPNISSQSTSSSGSKSPTKNVVTSLSNNKDNSTLMAGNKQLNAIAQLSKKISKTNGQSQGKSTQDCDTSQSNLNTSSTLPTAPQSKKRTQYHKMMNRNQGEPTVREMLSPQIKYSRNKIEQQPPSLVSRTNGIMTQNASFINYPANVYPQQMLVAAGYPNFPGQPIYSNTPYSYLVPASNSLPTQIINNESTSPPKLAPVVDNTTTEINGNKPDTDEFKEMPDIQHTKTQVKDDNTSAKENSKPAKIKKLVDEKDIEEVGRAFEKEAEKCSGLRGGRKRKVLKHSLDGGTMIEEHPEPPKHVLKKTLEKIVPGKLLESARNSRDKKKLNVPTPEKRKGTSKEIQRLLEMDFGVGKSPFEETNYDKYSQSILKIKKDNDDKASIESSDVPRKGFCPQCNGLLPSPRTRKSEVKYCSKECERQHNSKNRRSLRDNVSLSSDGAKEPEPSSSKEPTTTTTTSNNEVKKGRGGRRSKNVKNELPTEMETPKTSKKTPTPKQSPNTTAPNLVPEVSNDQVVFKSPSSKSVNEEDKSPMPVLESAKSPTLSPQVTPKDAVANSIFTIEGLDVYKVKSWTPYEVMLWVNGLCKNELGQIFKDEEIDGECLLILDKETLKQHLQFKVGPSMKILEEIKKLKELQKLS